MSKPVTVPVSTIKPQSGKNNLIKFHIRSDVFSFPAIWAEATRTLHKNWKQLRIQLILWRQTNLVSK